MTGDTKCQPGSELVRILREKPYRSAMETEDQAKLRRQAERERGADRIEALEAALGRIERGGTSVLLDAALNDDPINPDVLQQIVTEAGAALSLEGRGGAT